MISKKKIIILVLAACVLGGSLILINRPKKNEDVVKHREHTVVIGDIIVGIDGAGKLKLEETEHYFNVDGIIEEIAVKKGQKVNEGDFIAKISDKEINKQLDELRLDLSAKQSSLDQFKKQRDGIKDNKSQEYISLESQVKTAQTEVDKVYQKIDDLEDDLDNLSVYAKTSGVIVEVGYEVGAQGTGSKAVVAVGDEKKAYLEALVPQTDIVDINEEQEVNVTLEAYPDSEIKGKVIEKSYVNSGEGMDVDYKVKALLEINDLEVYQGMTGEIKFIIKGKEDVLQIPNKFIYMKDNKQMVKVRTNNKLEDREIKTGFSDGKLTEILEGLKSGETVIEER